MSHFLFVIGRGILISFVIIGASIGYLYFCGWVSKRWPRLGHAMSAVLGAGVMAFFAAWLVTVLTGSPRLGVASLVPVYSVSFIGLVIFAFKQEK